MTGWVCPVCGEVNGPFQQTCVAGPHRKVITTSSTVCSCRTTLCCPLHPSWSVN